MLNLVTILQSKVVDGIRRVQFRRYGKNDIQEKQVVQPFGIDGNPREDTIALYAPTGENGKEVIVGYLNKNAIADIGELHLYATESGSSTKKCYIHLKNDGQIHLNGSGDNLMRYENTKDVVQEIQTKIDDLVNIMNAWTPVPNDGGASLKTLLTSSGWTAVGLTQNIAPSKIDELEVDP